MNYNSSTSEKKNAPKFLRTRAKMPTSIVINQTGIILKNDYNIKELLVLSDLYIDIIKSLLNNKFYSEMFVSSKMSIEKKPKYDFNDYLDEDEDSDNMNLKKQLDDILNKREQNILIKISPFNDKSFINRTESKDSIRSICTNEDTEKIIKINLEAIIEIQLALSEASKFRESIIDNHRQSNKKSFLNNIAQHHSEMKIINSLMKDCLSCICYFLEQVRLNHEPRFYKLENTIKNTFKIKNADETKIHHIKSKLSSYKNLKKNQNPYSLDESFSLSSFCDKITKCYSTVCQVITKPLSKCLDVISKKEEEKKNRLFKTKETMEMLQSRYGSPKNNMISSGPHTKQDIKSSFSNQKVAKKKTIGLGRKVTIRDPLNDSREAIERSNALDDSREIIERNNIFDDSRNGEKKASIFKRTETIFIKSSSADNLKKR